MESEQTELKERSDRVRRQITQLNALQNKLEMIKKENVDADRRDGLTKEAQSAFDRYLRTFASDSKALKRKSKALEVNDTAEIAAFKSKWADFLVEEQSSADDVRPMLGLDSYDAGLKPMKFRNGRFVRG